MANEKKVDTETVITVSPSELKKMIEDAVLDLSGEKPTAGFNEAALGQVIGDAVAQGIAKNTRPKVTVGEYVRRGYSVFHPKGPGPKLRRATFQNDAQLDPSRLSDEEITLLNQITHAGRYIDRLVEVFIGQDGSDDVVYLRYNNQTPDQRFDLKGKIRNLEDMLRQIVTKQQEEDAEFADQEDHRRTERRRQKA